MKKILYAFVVVLVLGMSVVVASASEYVLGEGDSLAVNVWGEPDLNGLVIVRPDGMITLPGVGDVQAAGKTPSKLRSSLTTKLKELVRNPIVTVSVQSFQNNSVVVHGAGIDAQVVPLVGQTTLLRLLTSINPGNMADLKKAYLVRGEEKLVEGFEDLYMRGDMTNDIVLKAGDRIFVPYRSDRFVFVLGAVEAPQAIPYMEGFTVLEAILQSGGFGKYADEDDTVIIRTKDGKKSVIRVKGDDLVNKGNLDENVELLAGDYVVVREGLF